MVACRCSPSRALTSVDLPTPLAPRKATVRPDPSWRHSSSSPPSARPLDTNTGTPRATSCSSRRAGSGSATRSPLVSRTIGLGPAVERQHQFTLETTLVRRHGEGVTEKDDVDVRRQGVGDGACTFERGATDERRASRRARARPVRRRLMPPPSHRRRLRHRCCEPVPALPRRRPAPTACSTRGRCAARGRGPADCPVRPTTLGGRHPIRAPRRVIAIDRASTVPRCQQSQ